MPADADIIDSFIAREHLPDDYRRQAEQWFLPQIPGLVEAIHQGQLRVLGITGSQGSGKSTLAGLLQAILSEHYQLRVVNLSLDDFYLSHGERERLASTVHPLLASRGVPGTHDIRLALDTLLNLREGSGPVALPRFDKAQDDCVPRARWQSVIAPVDLIIFEGWCLGVTPQADDELARSVNTLEREQDSDGRWREFVNRRLHGDYAELFDLIDFLIFMRAPNFAAVHRWRQLQEDKLRARLQREGNTEGNKVMDQSQLATFMQHFERLTQHAISQMSAIANIEYRLNDNQVIMDCIKHSPGAKKPTMANTPSRQQPPRA